MAAIEVGLYTWWTANSTLCGLAGSRLYPGKLPQGTSYPAVVYQLVGEEVPTAHDGALDLVTDTIQFDVYASSGKAAKALARTLRQEMHGFQGTMGTVAVHSVFLVNMVGDFGDDLGVDRVSMDFRFSYKEA